MPDEATNFFHAVIAFDMGLRLLYVEDGSRLTPIWSVLLSPATVLLSGCLPEPLYPGMGRLLRSCPMMEISSHER